jgi:hypothetical protein
VAVLDPDRPRATRLQPADGRVDVGGQELPALGVGRIPRAGESLAVDPGDPLHVVDDEDPRRRCRVGGDRGEQEAKAERGRGQLHRTLRSCAAH